MPENTNDLRYRPPTEIESLVSNIENAVRDYYYKTGLRISVISFGYEVDHNNNPDMETVVEFEEYTKDDIPDSLNAMEPGPGGELPPTIDP